MTRAELKEKSKKSLEGKYWETIKMFIVYCLVFFAVPFVIGFIGGILDLNPGISILIADVAIILVSAVLTMGMNSYFLKLSRDQEVNFTEIFSKKNYLIPYLCITVLTFIFVYLWSLLFIIPGIVAAISYSMVYFIALDNPELKANQVLKKSKELMQGHKWEYVVFVFSFLGWIILATFTFGLLYFWLLPYMSVAYANFYNNLLSEN